MVCATCGAEIAEKAIICYRCGAPTSAPVPRHAPPRTGRTRSIIIGLVAAAVAAAAAGVLAHACSLV